MKFLVSFLCLGLFVLAQAQAPIKLSNIVRIKDKIPEGNTNAVAVDPRIGLIYVAGQGHISIHAQNERLALLPHQEITGEKQNGPNDKVIICPLGNTIWVGDKTGLGTFALNDLGGKSCRNLLKDTKISGIIPWKRDTVLVLAEKKLMLMPGKIQLSAKSYQGIAKVAGHIYAARQDSVFYWSVKEKKFVLATKRHYPKLINIFNTGEQLAIVTQDSLFLREKGKDILKQILPTKQKVSSVKKLAIEKALYIATFDGLFKINEGEKKYDTIDLRTIDNIPLKIILSLEISNDNLLIGTRAGGVHIYSPQRSKTFIPFHLTDSLATELHDYAIRSFAIDFTDKQHPNRFYFGNDRGQVFHATYEAPGKAIQVSRLNFRGKPWLQIRSIATYKDQVIFGTGTDTARVYFYSGRSKKIVDSMVFSKATVISSLYRLHDSLYVGTDSGLFRLNLALKQKVQPKKPIDRSEIKNITDEGWVCSRGKIGKITPQGSVKWYHFKAKDKEFHKLDLLHLAPIDQNHVYVFNRAFLQRVRIDKDSVFVEKKYDESNGLIGFDNAKANIIYGGFLDKKQNLWISSNYGLYCKVKGQDNFARFTPPILGLPDNVDANTGAFLRLNNGLLLFGFRHGGVVVNTMEYDTLRPIKMALFEKQDDKFMRILESGSRIKKNNLVGDSYIFPFNLDLTYGGDQPILIKNKYNITTSQVGEAELISIKNWKIRNTFFKDKLEFYGNPQKNQSAIFIRYTELKLYLILISIFLLLIGRRYRKRKKQELEKQRTELAKKEAEKLEAEAKVQLANTELEKQKTEFAKKEAEKLKAEAKVRLANTELEKQKTELAKKEAEKLEAEAISTLSNKALGEHFLKNNIYEIIKQETLDKEIYQQPLLRSIVTSMEVEEIKQIITGIDAELKFSKGSVESAPGDIEAAAKEYLKYLPKKRQVLLDYAEFFRGILKDKETSRQVRDDIEGYYLKLVKTSIDHSIIDDAEFIKSLIKLYMINPRYAMEIDLPNRDYSSGAIRIDAMQEEFKNARIPRMLVQPLVENARKYGSKPCKIEVVYKQALVGEKQEVIISVTNNGSWRNESSDKQMPSASASTQERSLSIIEMELERRGGSLSRKETEGNVCVEIRIPIHIQNLKA